MYFKNRFETETTCGAKWLRKHHSVCLASDEPDCRLAYDTSIVRGANRASHPASIRPNRDTSSIRRQRCVSAPTECTRHPLHGRVEQPLRILPTEASLSEYRNHATHTKTCNKYTCTTTLGHKTRRHSEHLLAAHERK
jgi:hypothetical protein